MLSPAEFGGLFDSFASTAFRVETLPQYLVDEEAEEVRTYLRGDPAPDSIKTDNDWRTMIRSKVKEGGVISRVHLVESPLTDYLRYECEWGYAFNTLAGERVDILDLTEVTYEGPRPEFDFWLFDDRIGVRMFYGEDGRYEGADRVDDADLDQLRTWRDAVVAAAVPFADYWSTHPQFHRDGE